MATVSHTMNFKYTDITTKRDLSAFEKVNFDSAINQEMISKYFTDVSQNVIENPEDSIINDFKPNMEFSDITLWIAQIEIWEQEKFIEDNLNFITNLLKENTSEYKFYMWASIKNWETYFIWVDEKSKELLTKTLGITFEGNIWIYENIIIRKEIIKLILKLWNA